MFDNTHPKNRGRNSPLHSQIHNLTSDGKIGILNPNGYNGVGMPTDPYLYIAGPLNTFETMFSDVTRHVLVNPTDEELFEGAIYIIDHQKSDRYSCLARGRFGSSGQYIDVYLNSEFIATIGTSSAGGHWHFDFDIIVENVNESVMSGKWSCPGHSGFFQYSDFDGTGYNFDFTNKIILGLRATDTVGWGTDITCDMVNAYYAKGKS